MPYMVPADDFTKLLDSIAKNFLNQGKRPSQNQVRMVGLVFARPNSPLAKSEIIPQLNDWHYRSGRSIDFYFAGYARTSDKDTDRVQVRIPGAKSWWYSSSSFEVARNRVEISTSWQYGGSCELLLTNAHFDTTWKSASLDFATTICCQLDVMKTDKAIVSVERFFESVFRFAEKSTGKDPTWGFSDKLGLSVGRSALQQVVLSLLPKSISAEYTRAQHFAVRDIGLIET